jgi:ubiquitin-protein ligase
MKKVIKDNNEYLSFVMDESNMFQWYVLASNLPEPYLGGEYLFSLEVPKTFPEQPPSLKSLTHNGVFIVGCKICVSIGEFHSNDSSRDGAMGWRASLGLGGFSLNGIVNAMLNFDSTIHGIGIQLESTEHKKIAATKSHIFNDTHNPHIIKIFKDIQTTHPDLLAIKSWRK